MWTGGASNMKIGRATTSVVRWILLAPLCLPVLGGQPASFHRPRIQAELRARALIQPNGRYAGVQYQTALNARSILLKQQSIPSASNTLYWSELGPGNVGGRLNAVWVDPNNAQHLLAGSASGGLWQSNDGGTSWSAVSEFPGALTIGAIAQLPDGTLLVGTGDVFTAAGDGLFSSTDGGTTWTPVVQTAPQTSGSFWLVISSIAVSGNVILASTWGGVARSTDDGQTWTQVWNGTHTHTANSMDVVFDPNNPSDAVADSENGEVEYSTDAGLSWTPATLLSTAVSGARVSLAFDPSQAGSVYALVDNNNGTSPSGQVYHSSDDGATWSLLADTGAFVNSDSSTAVGALCDNAGTGPTECQGSYDNVMLVEPHGSGTPPTILAGGIDIFASTDGGSTWSETGSWLGNDSDYIHADQHAFTYDPSTKTLYVGNDGGFYKQLTANTWKAYNEGLADTQFFSVAGHSGTTASLNTSNGTPITPIIAGAQDNGTLLYLGYSSGGAPQPDDWVPIFGGDGGVTQVDPADGNDLFGEYVKLQLFFSTTGAPPAANYSNLPSDSNTNANFIAPFVLVPSAGAPASEMLAGGASLWLGDNIATSSPTWRSINSSGMPASTANSNYVSAIAVDPSNSNDVWVGYDDGEVWYSNDALNATGWSRKDTGVMPGRAVTSFWIVPGQSSTVYATFGGYPAAGSSSNVWGTTDGGTTWTDVGQGLPGAPVYSLITHPAYPQILYAGTLTGVYVSSDDGQSWSTSSLGPANVEVRQLSWFDTSSPDSPTMLAATFGRGAWLGSPTYNPTPTLTSISPTQITVGSVATTITLTGSGFVQNVSTVTLDGSPISATDLSATELQVTAPASVLSTTGTHTLVVSNPLPGGGTSAGANFTVANPVPVLNSISPSSATAGSPSMTLTVAGGGFVSGSTVEWNGSALPTTYLSATQLDATVPLSDLASASQAQITVFTAQPGGGTSAAVGFTVHAQGGGGGALSDVALLLLLGANGLVWLRMKRA